MFLHHTNFSSTDQTLSPHTKRLPHVAVHSSLPSVYIHSPTWKVHSCYKQQTINYHKCSRLVAGGTQASLSCDQGHALLGTWTIGNLDYWELGMQSSSSDVIYKFFWGLCLMENLSVSGHWNWGHSIDSHLFVQVQYCIAGNFWGRKLSQIGEKYDLCSVDCSFVPHQRMPCPKIRGENSHKTAKFANIFFCQKFPAIRYSETIPIPAF